MSAAAAPSPAAVGAEPGGENGSTSIVPAEPPKEHINWSIFPKLTVSFAFMRRLTFRNMKRYVTVGQLRELVAQELMLPTISVHLKNSFGAPLLLNSMTLEDALEGSTQIRMVRALSSHALITPCDFSSRSHRARILSRSRTRCPAPS